MTNLNAADLFMVIVVVMLIRTGWRRGIIEEFVKLFGIFCTIFIALHYYVRFADFLRVQFFGRNTSAEFFAFSILAILLLAASMLIGRGWVLILRLKLNAAIDRYGGLFLALVRSYFTYGLIFFALILAGHGFATPSAKRSASCSIFRYVATDFYRASYSVLIEDFFPGEKINEDALKLMEGKSKRVRKQ